MTEKELISHIARQTAISKQVTEQLLQVTADTINETLDAGGTVKISGFGSWETRTHKSRTIVNPRNGQTTIMPEKQVKSFKPADALKEQVNPKK